MYVTPNMGLIGTSIGVDTGLTQEQNANANTAVLDSHNHTNGQGVPIPPAGLNINTALPFNGNIASAVYGIQFSNPLASALTTFLYTAPSSGGGVDDLFYNDAAGNTIQLTKAGTVNATIGSLPGQSYAAGTFVWKQGTGSTTPANFDIGSITIRPNIASTTNGITVSPPSGISSAYNLVLPALPGSTSFVTLDSSGNLATASNISAAQIATASITGTQIAAGTIAISNIVAVNYQESASTGTITCSNSAVPTQLAQVTITTSGNPVMVMFQGDDTNTVASITVTAGSTSIAALGSLQLTSNAAAHPFNAYQFGAAHNGSVAAAVTIMPSFQFMDFPSAGTITYTMSGFPATSNTVVVENCKLVAYEVV